MWYWFLLSLACASREEPALGLHAEGSLVPRVAVVHGQYDDRRHRDDYDRVLSGLGWPMEKIPNESIARALRQEASFDLIVGTALYNYQPAADWGQEASDWLDFMERGGAVLLTDTNYASHVDWLEALGTGWEASVFPCETKPSHASWARPAHPLVRGMDNPGGVWAHLSLGQGYDVIARDAEGMGTLAVRGHGKGYLVLSCHWPLDREFLEAAWDLLRQRRAGLEIQGPDWELTVPGKNRWTVTLRNVTDRSLRGEAGIDISGPCGFALSRRASVKMGPFSIERIAWKGTIQERGPHGAAFLWEGRDGSRYVETPTSIRVPAPVELQLIRPGYRGSLYQACPPQSLEVRVRVSPSRKKGRPYRLRLSVEQEGAWRAARDLGRVRQAVEDVSFALPAFPSKEVTVDGVLDWPRGQAQQRLEIPWVEERECQVVVAPDLALLRDGEPAFPVGIYHVPRDSLKEAADMGFNCCQAWGTDPSEAKLFLDEAEACGMSVLLECSSFLRQGELDPLMERVDAFKDHPALLAWYLLDEPAEDKLSLCREALERVQEADPDHPAYLVSCRPSQFPGASEVTDILAVDPYPIPHRSVDLVAAWMRDAWTATRGRKPVWLIPQLHNPLAYRDPSKGRGPTPAEERCMVYLGLLLGAKGIVYYPWDDGPCGLVHDPDLMKAVAQLNREISELAPYLLRGERTGSSLTEPQDRDVPYWARFDLGGRCLVLLCNPTPREAVWALREGPVLEKRYGEGSSAKEGSSLHVTLPGLGTWAAEGAL